jgi:hypothetical protein
MRLGVQLRRTPQLFGRLAEPRQNGVLANYLSSAIRRSSISNRAYIDDHRCRLRLARVHNKGLPAYQPLSATLCDSAVRCILDVTGNKATARSTKIRNRYVIDGASHSKNLQQWSRNPQFEAGSNHPCVLRLDDAGNVLMGTFRGQRAWSVCGCAQRKSGSEVPPFLFVLSRGYGRPG